MALNFNVTKSSWNFLILCIVCVTQIIRKIILFNFVFIRFFVEKKNLSGSQSRHGWRSKWPIKGTLLNLHTYPQYFIHPLSYWITNNNRRGKNGKKGKSLETWIRNPKLNKIKVWTEKSFRVWTKICFNLEQKRLIRLLLTWALKGDFLIEFGTFFLFSPASTAICFAALQKEEGF